ncbi:MAG: DNA-binding NtrC family response regulator [Glaciecola sp.]|jgi:DNA-binding NtrC family response regulator
MRMFYQALPDYRALVIENERDFRTELVYLIESLDMGFSVIDEASDYEEALQLLDSGDYDLLITDINLTDAATFQVGDRDGIALANYARQNCKIPSIFLTAFADYDTEVVKKAAASDPIGFIRKQGSEIGEEVQVLITLALRRLEQSRRERELTLQLESVVKHIGEALLYINDDGLIIDFNDDAATLLGQRPDALIDQHWEDVVRLETTEGVGEQPLRSIINAGLSARLPFLALRQPDGSSALVSIYVALTEHLRQECTMLVIKDLQKDRTFLEPSHLETGSTIAMFGLVPAATNTAFDPVQQKISLLRLQSALLTRIRASDSARKGTTTSVALFLPDTDEGSGLTIVRSLVFDLEVEFARQNSPMHVYAGLAHRGADQSINATVATAIDALDRAQSGLRERVLGASALTQVRDEEYHSHSTDAESSFLSQAFAVTERTLAAPMSDVTSTEALSAVLAAALEEIESLSFFGLYISTTNDGGHWFCLRQRGPKGAFVACDLSALPDQIAKQIVRQHRSAPLAVSTLSLSDANVILCSLRQADQLLGQLFIVSSMPALTDRVFTMSEAQIAGVWGRYLGQLLLQCADYHQLKAPKNPQNQADYNLYALADATQELATVRLLLNTDTPIALVGSSGMAVEQLLIHAAETVTPPLANGLRVIDHKEWDSGVGEVDAEPFIRLLQTQESTLLVVQDPDRLPLELQSVLGEAMLSRQIWSNGAAHALPRLRFAVSLSQPPLALCNEGRLHERLASALGAGVVTLPTISGDADHAIRWAEKILAAENQLTNSRRRFDDGALSAISSHSWGGNIEELQARIRTAIARSPRQAIGALDLDLYRLRAVDQDSNALGMSGNSPAILSEKADYAIEAALEIAIQMVDPPPVGEWLEDELTDALLDAHEGDSDPVARSAEALNIDARVFNAWLKRSSQSAAERQAAPFWLNTRLTLRPGYDTAGRLEAVLRGQARDLVLQKLILGAYRAPRERILQIAGCSLEDYLEVLNRVSRL